MPDIKVRDEQGRVHVFPDGSTPEMIAEAMGLKPASATGGIDVDELQRNTMRQARNMPSMNMQPVFDPLHPISRKVFESEAPGDILSEQYGRSIGRQDAAALRAGRPSLVAPSTTRMAKKALDYGKFAMSPEGAAWGVGLAAAHTNPVTAAMADAALLGYGGGTMLANAPDAFDPSQPYGMGNPDALENFLQGGAMTLPAIGSAARTVPIARTALAKRIYEPSYEAPKDISPGSLIEAPFKPGVSKVARGVTGMGGGILGAYGGSVLGPAGAYGGAATGSVAGAGVGPWLLRKTIPQPAIPTGAIYPAFEEFEAANRLGGATPARESPVPGGYTGPPKPPKPPAPPGPPLGSPENPAYHSKLPTRLPPGLRKDPFDPYVATGAIYPSFEDFEQATRVAKPVPLTESPYATQHEAAAAFEQGKKGPYNLLSESPEPHDPFSPGAGEAVTDLFSPARSSSDTPMPRPFEPLIATPEEVGPLGKTGTIGQLKRVMKDVASTQGMFSAAYGKTGRKLNYPQRTAREFSKSVPSPTPSSPTAPPPPSGGMPPTRFTKGGERIDVETEHYTGSERRADTPLNIKTRKIYDMQKELLETDAEREAKGLGSISSIKAGAGYADRITDALYPGKKYSDFPEGSPERRAVQAVFERIKPQRGK